MLFAPYVPQQVCIWNKVLKFLILKRSRNDQESSLQDLRETANVTQKKKIKISTFCHYIQLLSRLMFIRNLFLFFSEQ